MLIIMIWVVGKYTKIFGGLACLPATSMVVDFCNGLGAMLDCSRQSSFWAGFEPLARSWNNNVDLSFINSSFKDPNFFRSLVWPLLMGGGLLIRGLHYWSGCDVFNFSFSDLGFLLECSWTGLWLAGNEGMEKNMQITIGIRVQGGNEGMEKKIVTIILGYIGITISNQTYVDLTRKP